MRCAVPCSGSEERVTLVSFSSGSALRVQQVGPFGGQTDYWPEVDEMVCCWAGTASWIGQQ